MTVKTQMIAIPETTLRQITKYLTEEPKTEKECLGEDETITYTTKFDDGIEMDIKCCGVQFNENESNTAWSEAVLFQNGCEVACSEPSDGFEGEWELEHDGVIYKTIIGAKTDKSKGDA